jgi:DNA-binding LytR/AlgR family response regulator
VKYTLILDEEKEETIIITAHKKNELIEEIEKLINNQKRALFGFVDDDIIPLDLPNIYAIYTSDNKVYVKTKNETLLVRERLYQIEEYLSEEFIKINQGCIVNMKKVLKFETSSNASIKVILKNGFSDYISRRELKNVKRRIGL